MTYAAQFYKNRQEVESRDVRSDLAAKQYAGRMGYDSIKVSSGYYVLSQSEGRQWHGPWSETGWRWQYLGERD